MKTIYSVVPVFLLLTACSSTPALRESAHIYKGKKYLDAGEYKKASIEFRVASQNMPKDAEPLYQLGLTYLRAGASQIALESFQKAVAVNPKHEDAQFQLALFTVATGKPELLLEAKPVLLARAAAHPAEAEAFGTLAMVEVKLDNKDEALKRLLEFAEKKPASYRPANLTVAVFMARQDVESAKEFSKALAEHAPDSPDAAVLRAEVLLATHDDAAADAEISRALSLKPDFREALMLRLRRQEINADPKGAEQTSESLSKLPEQQLWGAHARVLFAEKKFDHGVAEYQRALKEHGNASSLRDDYAASLIAAGRGKDAGPVVDGTLNDHPKDPTALLERATIEIGDGRLDAAARDIKTLRDMKRGSAELSFQESRIYAARGETVKEGDLLNEALQ